MIALYLSGTTHLSAGHNMALSQVLNRSMAQYVCMNAMKFKSDFNMHITPINKSSTRTSALKFYLNRSYSGMAASTTQTCYLAGHVQHSRDFPGAQNQKLKRAEELLGLACEIDRATPLLRVPSPTSTQTSQLVLIKRATHDELSATNLAPNNSGNRRQFTGEGFK
ncbi:sufE-like protein 2, chloroplastic [Dorcoceras hygrometricum]|uniref:SufE-like protein 2, chloroplastic n=1 Tax=Dorcoceras hygrometricum TaxID=472368 RepID=A0A2Z7DA01_9LAMI|nr:sufE-like protein 2, chloroplastic [Dorcoceras hygrometricum]